VGRVLKLPEHLIRLIAAGEVIERPASVVKELLENSLDAGATRVAIDVWGAGQSRIRISDNGCGMTREDAEMAIDRHATSKLSAFDDLHRLTSFGFRGEALPSIAAVSRLELTTRTAESPEGWRMKLEGGLLRQSSAAGVPPGTTIDVQDLFFNTPARAKFMKRDATERSHILRIIQELAIVHPHIQFETSFEGKSVFSLAPADLHGRLRDLWGLEVADGLTAVDSTAGPCRIHGMLSTSQAHQASKGFQILYVNNRPVQQRAFVHAIYEAYRDNLPVGRHPAFALFVDIDPALVDVNVHPTKREVRFSNERAAYDVLYRTLRDSLAKQMHSSIPLLRKAEDGEGRGATLESQSLFVQDRLGTPLPEVPGTGFSFQEARGVLLEDAPAAHRFLGQFQNLYLLFEAKGEFLIMDQHAAAERVLYERLLEESATAPSARQTLLVPLLFELTPAQMELLPAMLPDFDRLGFGLEPFGARTYALKEWPSILPESKQAKRFFEELLNALEKERPTDRTQIQHEIAARAACRAAIMAGDPVTSAEALQLVEDLFACQRPQTCPHGRPTTWTLTLEDLNKRFRRP